MNMKLKSTGVFLKKKSVQSALKSFEGVHGPVLLDGVFAVTNVDDDLYKFSYLHPTSKHTSDDNTKVLISMFLKKSFIEPSFTGIYAQSIGRTLKLRVYGEAIQPIDKSLNVWELKIVPLAIY
jgi:hypothetical protein